jgi:hypothetical protein
MIGYFMEFALRFLMRCFARSIVLVSSLETNSRNRSWFVFWFSITGSGPQSQYVVWPQ